MAARELRIVPTPAPAPAPPSRQEPPGVHVAVADLRPGLSPRSALDHDHVATLAEAHGAWPPILVQRATLRIVDGHHRVAAAEHLGLRTVEATYFDGNDDEAELYAIRCNVRHGLPLTLADRKRAARTLLVRHPTWSDRAIADVCGLAAKTVARLRSSLGGLDRERHDRAAVSRLGRDGRVRPVPSAERRHVLVEALSSDPGASLRTIANRVGVSPETVRRMRHRLRIDLDRDHDHDRGPTQWQDDTACASTAEGLDFAAWFDRHAVDLDECLAHAGQVPLSRVYEVIDETRRRIAAWERFTDELAARARRAR